MGMDLSIVRSRPIQCWYGIMGNPELQNSINLWRFLFTHKKGSYSGHLLEFMQKDRCYFEWGLPFCESMLSLNLQNSIFNFQKLKQNLFFSFFPDMCLLFSCFIALVWYIIFINIIPFELEILWIMVILKCNILAIYVLC